MTRQAKKYLNKTGFEFIDTAELELKEQIDLFHNASTIISASGSACANIIFASPQTRVIVLVTPALINFDIWRTLSYISGCTVEYLELHPLYKKNRYLDPYRVMHSPMLLTKRDLLKLEIPELKSKLLKTKVKPSKWVNSKFFRKSKSSLSHTALDLSIKIMRRSFVQRVLLLTTIGFDRLKYNFNRMKILK